MLEFDKFSLKGTIKFSIFRYDLKVSTERSIKRMDRGSLLQIYDGNLPILISEMSK